MARCSEIGGNSILNFFLYHQFQIEATSAYEFISLNHID